MTAFALTLDTKAPEIGWDSPDVVDGQFSVPYSLDEPQLVSVDLLDEAGVSYPITVWTNRIFGAVPAGKSLRLSAHVRDQVGNDAIRTLPFLAPMRTLVRASDALKTLLRINDH